MANISQIMFDRLPESSYPLYYKEPDQTIYKFDLFSLKWEQFNFGNRFYANLNKFEFNDSPNVNFNLIFKSAFSGLGKINIDDSSNQEGLLVITYRYGIGEIKQQCLELAISFIPGASCDNEHCICPDAPWVPEILKLLI